MQQTYEQFRSDLADSIRSIPGEKKNVSVRRVPKLNGVSYYGLTILGEGESVSPAIYLEPYYEMYRAGMSLDTVAGLVMKERESHRVLPVPVETLTAFSEVRDRIRYRVINYEMNKEFLQDIPFRRVLDLAVVLYYTVDLRLSETATIFVRCDTVRRWGVSEEDLFSLAESATPVADPPCVCPLRKRSGTNPAMCRSGLLPMTGAPLARPACSIRRCSRRQQLLSERIFSFFRAASTRCSRCPITGR